MGWKRGEKWKWGDWQHSKGRGKDCGGSGLG